VEPGRWAGVEGAPGGAQYDSDHPGPSRAPRARPWDATPVARPGGAGALGLGMGVRGETGGLGSRAAGPAARGPPRHLAGRPRGIGELTAIVGGSRRCPPSASLEDVGEGPRRTNRASQSPAPGTDSPERNRRRQASDCRSPKVAPPDPRGARPRAAAQAPPGPRRPFIVGRSGEGGTEAGTKPGRTRATLPPQDASRKGRRRRADHGLGRDPTTPGPLPGWRARRPLGAGRECTGRASPGKRP
jgi:hypothetical protein